MESNYATHALDCLAVELPGNDRSLLSLYTLLVFCKGSETTLEDVHDAWAMWRSATRPDHPALVPFDDLAPDIQELDRPYVEAIHRIAARLGT